MRIVIDARYLNGRYSGIAQYSENLLKHLAAEDTKNEYVVFVHPNYKKDLELGENFTVKRFDARPVSLATLFKFGAAVRRENPSLLHSLFPLTPIFYSGPLLVTVHDLQALLVPEFTGRRPAVVRKAYDIFYWTTYPWAIRRARFVVADSEATRRDIARVFPRYADRTIVVHGGVDVENLRDCPPELVRRVREQRNLPERYVLYIGSTRPNKNLPNMIRAYALAVREHAALRDIALVLVISPDRFFVECRKLIQTLKIQDRVVTCRNITEDEKKAFYHGSCALYMVTKFEGFGLPLLEAQACGVPVLASNHAALPEIGGDAALYVDPDDTRAIADGLNRILSDEQMRRDLAEKAKRNLKRFSWKKTAQMIAQIYNHLF